MSRNRWTGPRPRMCDFCRARLNDRRRQTDSGYSPWFVDGRTKAGPWAMMCPVCFAEHGVGLGIGLGQRYDALTGERMPEGAPFFTGRSAPEPDSNPCHGCKDHFNCDHPCEVLMEALWPKSKASGPGRSGRRRIRLT